MRAIGSYVVRSTYDMWMFDVVDDSSLYLDELQLANLLGDKKLLVLEMSSNSSQTTRTTSWKEAAISGAAAGALSRTILAPVERIKLIRQLALTSTPAYQHLSVWQVVAKVYQEQGIASFWRGNVPSMLRVAGTAAINFTCMDYYKHIATNHLGIAPGVGLSLAAGGCAGLTATTTLYPVEFLRTRLAMDVEKQRRPGKELVVRIFQKEGIAGFYQGFGIAAAGGVVYRVILLGGYDALKDKLPKENGGVPWLERICLAQTVSLSAATVAYPFDSIRRRLMMQSGDVHQYRNAIHCAREIIGKEGYGGFYLGFGVSIIRSISGALLLVSYDGFRSLFG